MTKHGWDKLRHFSILYAALVVPSGKPDVEIKNFRLIEVQNQVKQIEVNAPHAEVFQNKQINRLESPHANVWGQNEQPYVIEGNEGIIQTYTQNLLLRKNCMLTSPDGTVFQSENLYYNKKHGTIQSDDDVIAHRKSTAINDNVELTGKGLLIDINTDVYKVLSNVQARRRGNDKQDLRILSQQSTIYPNRNLAYFIGNVRVYSKNMELNGDRLQAKLKNNSKVQGLEKLELESSKNEDDKITAKLEKINLYSKAVNIFFDNNGEFSQLEADGAVDAVTTDNVKMRSENLVYKKVNGKEKVLLKDNVEIQTEDRKAKCQEAEYSPDTGEILLNRVATVKKGDQILKGEKIRFSLKNSQVFVEKASGEMLRENLGF